MNIARCILLLIILAPDVDGQGHLTSTTDISDPTTEENWSPFPTDDILNNPWLRKIRFCVDLCFSEDKLQGLRNLWPYLYPLPSSWEAKPPHSTHILNKAKDIAVNPELHDRLYCFLDGYPQLGEDSLKCMLGNSTVFLSKWKHSPIGMLTDIIPLSVFNAVLASLSLVFGIFGNILIIVTILTRTGLRTSTNLLLVGMAVADFFNSNLVVFYAYLDTFLQSVTNPILGPWGCNFVQVFKELSQLAAANHLITLSFERYFAICWPMNTSLKFTKKKTIMMIIVSWLISAVQLIGFIQLRINFQSRNFVEYICIGKRLNYTQSLVLVFYTLTVYLILPVPILCFNYFCVVRTLFTSIKRSREMTGDSSGQTNTEKARLRLTYMMIALVLIYIATVAPGRIMYSLYFFKVFYYEIQYMAKVAGFIDLL